MTQPQPGMQVPLEGLLTAVEEQRNAALTEAAQMKALARQLLAENDKLKAELEKLRAEATDGAASPSSANGATTTPAATPART